MIKANNNQVINETSKKRRSRLSAAEADTKSAYTRFPQMKRAGSAASVRSSKLSVMVNRSNPVRDEPIAIRNPNSSFRRFTRNQNEPITARNTLTNKKSITDEITCCPLELEVLSRNCSRILL